MTLKIIGTGFGRTGTDSMRKALNILGIGPTHHMHELGNNAPLREPWLQLVRGKQPDWEQLFSGYNACVDWPSAYSANPATARKLVEKLRGHHFTSYSK